ncbi:ABC transporter permease [Desulfothermobacter acidiphilus]|uniref:ABC transporter permease n=1 Tax=Desulfothermobacter acidiphilus TaxID=1938353 RepID=UPI003F8C2270
MSKQLSSLTALLVLLVLWELMAKGLHLPALPPASQALAAFFKELPGPLGFNWLVSTYRILAGMFLATVSAVPLGLFLGRCPWADRLLGPFFSLIYPVPKVVLVPLIMVIVGLGDSAKILLITLVLFFQILLPVRDGARHLSPYLVDAVTALGVRGLAFYWHVVFPAVLPEVLTGLRVASGTAIAVLFFAETIASQEGLGYYLLDAWTRYAYPDLYAGVLAMSLLGFILYSLLEWLERRLCHWKYL